LKLICHFAAAIKILNVLGPVNSPEMWVKSLWFLSKFSTTLSHASKYAAFMPHLIYIKYIVCQGKWSMEYGWPYFSPSQNEANQGQQKIKRFTAHCYGVHHMLCLLLRLSKTAPAAQRTANINRAAPTPFPPDEMRCKGSGKTNRQ